MNGNAINQLSCYLIMIFLLSACDKGSSGSQNLDFPFPDLSNSHAYVENSPQALALKSCVSATQAEDSCTFTTLPLIGMQYDQPTIDQIMSHVIVSHDWMGLRFQNLLSQLPSDMLNLLKATTAIVIDDSIRPSFYYGLTGAIYIDPAYLWLNNEEKENVLKTADYRANFGATLQFSLRTRSMIGSEYASESFPLNGNEERTIEDIVVPASSLLFHELAHANDCMPIQDFNSIESNQRYFELFLQQIDNGDCINQQLNDTLPLSSSLWKALGDVLFHGEASSNELQALTALAAGENFSDDTAISFYSFSTTREDTAQLFEMLMMKKHFNVDRDIATIEIPKSNLCVDTTIAWGQRGRLAEPDIFARSEFVSKLIFPDLDLISFEQSLADMTPIAEGTSWCTLDLSESSSLQAKSIPKINLPIPIYEERPFM